MMTGSENRIIRLCEYGSVVVSDVQAGQRQAIAEAVSTWCGADGDPALYFSGPTGSVLHASDQVGVVEVAGITIEIYPKLDSSLIASDLVPDTCQVDTVMRNLLWMMQVSGHMDLTEADAAHLRDTPLAFYEAILNFFSFAVLGGLLQLSFPHRRRIHIALYALAFSAVIECVQTFLPERAAGVTDICVAAFGAWTGAHVCAAVESERLNNRVTAGQPS